MKKCPFCGEEVQDAAVKCKHCKEWLLKAGERAKKSVIVPASSSQVSNRGEAKSATGKISFLPLMLLVAAYTGNYVYSFASHPYYDVTGIQFHTQVFGLTILSISATIVYYIRQTNKTKIWALSISIIQIIGTFLAMYNVLYRQGLHQ